MQRFYAPNGHFILLLILFSLTSFQTKDMSSIPPPEVLKKPPYIPEKMLFGPGPSNMAEPIKESLGNPLLGYLHSEFTKVIYSSFNEKNQDIYRLWTIVKLEFSIFSKQKTS